MAIEAYAIGFTYGAFSQNWGASVGVLSIIAFLVFFASDGVMPLDVLDTYYHVWIMLVIILSSLAGHVYSRVMLSRPLIRLLYRSSEEDNVLVSADIVGALFHISAFGFVAGLNMWLKRLAIGLAPLGVDYEMTGIAITCVSGFLLLILSAALAALDVRARVSLKYTWLFFIWPLGFLVTDFGFYKYGWSSPWPEIWGLVSYLGISIVVIFLAIYLPIRNGYQDENGNDSRMNFDAFHHNSLYSRLFFGGIAINVAVAFIAFTLIASWTGGSLRRGAFTVGGTAIVSVLFSLYLFFAKDKTILRLKTKHMKAKVPKSVNLKRGSLFGDDEES